MNIQLVGLQKKVLESIIQESYPELTIVEQNPEMIVAFGGDGTLLYGEREFPGIPKVLVRNSLICDQCKTSVRSTVLDLLRDGTYAVEPHLKLDATINGQTLSALYDVMVGHATVNGSVRVRLFLNGEPYQQEVVGDGVIISTPIGSTGYYQSITRSTFQIGIGVAFNNSVNFVNHMVIKEDAILRIEVTRGPGIAAVDNNEDRIAVSTGDIIEIQKSAQDAQLVVFPPAYQQYNFSTHRMPFGFCQICSKHYA